MLCCPINLISCSSLIFIFNNYSSSPNGLWVNSPWGRRPTSPDHQGLTVIGINMWLTLLFFVFSQSYICSYLQDLQLFDPWHVEGDSVYQDSIPGVYRLPGKEPNWTESGCQGTSCKTTVKAEKSWNKSHKLYQLIVWFILLICCWLNDVMAAILVFHNNKRLSCEKFFFLCQHSL